MALYRRYRSATFDQVIGQEHVTEPLSTALRSGRINHAYLFSGPRGCGKTSSARILARSLNCAQGPTPTPCGICDSCRELAPNASGSIDVIEIDAASHNGVDDARELRERAYYGPVRDRYKVYIIDEAHMVTSHAFNALLKVVEEPPEHLIFIFATTEPDKVLQTIRSRTHHYPFRLVPPGVLRAHLERICVAEGVTVEQAVFPLVVRAGGGSVRDALSLLDQLLAGAAPQGVTYARAVALLGVTDSALLDDMIDALAVGDASSVYATIERVVQSGHEPRRFATDLLDRLRDLLVLSSVPDAAAKGLLDAPADALERMADQAVRVGTACAARYAEIVHTALTDMRGTTAARLLLELVCARMLLPDASTDAAALLQRIERLERVRLITGDGSGDSVGDPPAEPEKSVAASTPVAGSVGAEVSSSSSSSSSVASPPQPAYPRVAGEIDVTAVRQIWPEVLDVVKQASKRTRALMDTAQVASLEGTHLRLVMTTAPLVGMLSEASNSNAIAAALGRLLPGSWSVQVELAAALGDAMQPELVAAAPVTTTQPLEQAPPPPTREQAPPAPEPAKSGPLEPAKASPPEPAKPSPPEPAKPSPPEPAGTRWPKVVTAEATAAGREAAATEPAAHGPSVRRRATAKSAARSDVPESPLSDEPDPPDGYDDPSEPSTRHDPEAEALSLLETSLGAKRITD